MFVQANPSFLAQSADLPGKANWTELQHLQYALGIWDGVEGSPVRHRKLPERTWTPNDDWRSLSGILADHPEHDTTEMKRRDREWEDEHDARKVGALR